MERDALKYISLILLLNFSVLLAQVINRLSLGVEIPQLFYPATNKQLNLLFMFPVIAFVIIMLLARLKSKYKSIKESFLFSGIALILGIFTLFTAGLEWFGGGDDLDWSIIVFFTSALFIFGLIFTTTSNNSGIRKRLGQSVKI